MKTFANRLQAGQLLAASLKEYENHKDIVVLGLARGGIPVAYALASALHLPLDVFIVRKLGAPRQKELAMGAIALGGAVIFNDEMLAYLNLPQQEIANILKEEEKELNRRQLKYGNKQKPLVLSGKTVIIVDDGIATGATMSAAITAIRQLQPAALIVAVPIAAASTIKELKRQVDKIYCLSQPDDLRAISLWYDNFEQVSDEQVIDLLHKITRPA